MQLCGCVSLAEWSEDQVRLRSSHRRYSTTQVNFDTLSVTDICMLDYHPIHFPCLEVSKATIFPLGWAMLLTVATTVLTVIFVWWLSNVRQGQYGMAKPMCFCFNPKYMCPKRPYASDGSLRDTASGNAVLSIQHLRKVFPDGKVAVDDLCLDSYAGEIFALLGHNGAGKTTALNCAVGLIPPTSGETLINGHDVRLLIALACRRSSSWGVCISPPTHYNHMCSEELICSEHATRFLYARKTTQATQSSVCDNISSSSAPQLQVETSQVNHSFKLLACHVDWVFFCNCWAEYVEMERQFVLPEACFEAFLKPTSMTR